MKKNSGFKLRSGNKPSIAKFMGIKDLLGGKSKKGFKFGGAINMLGKSGIGFGGAIEAVRNLFGKK